MIHVEIIMFRAADGFLEVIFDRLYVKESSLYTTQHKTEDKK